MMTTKEFARWTRLLLTLSLMASLLSGCGYNQFQSKDEATKAAWSEVVNQYQRRADLIPNLVNTVKGYASHERETLEAVTRARPPPPASATCSRSWKAPRTGSPSRASVTSRRSRTTTWRCAASRTT